MFEAVGVSIDEERLYRLLLGVSPSTVDELAERVDGPTAQVGDTLEALVAKGMVRRVPGEVARYVPVDPDMAIEPLVQAQEERLRSTRVAAHRLTMEYHDSRVPHPARLVEVITGRDNVIHAVAQVQAMAKKEVRALSRPPYVTDVAAPNTIEEEKLAQSVRYRAVWDKAALEIPGILERIYGEIRLGEEARLFDGVPIRLLIADDRRAVVPLFRFEGAWPSAILVHPSELLTSLAALFEFIWRSARPVRAASSNVSAGTDPTAEPDLEPGQRSLLEMLANGFTDESIGKSLNWSVRTVQRRVRHLMDSLNVDTRFQAGMVAAKRGWL